MPECAPVNSDRYSLITEIVSTFKTLQRAEVVPAVSVVDPSKYTDLLALVEARKALTGQKKQLESLDNSIHTITSELSELATTHGFKICKNCGTVAV
ncbi:hypothetical protein D3C71_1870480 [compost metagenome]